MSSMTRNIKMSVDVDNPQAPAPVWVQANGDRLHQVLLNVLSNAVKYNDAHNPEIRIATYRDDDHVLIDISDNGSGVSRDDAAMIFEKFSRGDKSERGAGAGLGLPISRAIMRAMGGDLTIEFNEGEDSVSFFRIHLSGAQFPADAPQENPSN